MRFEAVVEAGNYVVPVWNTGGFPGTVTGISIVETGASTKISSEPSELTQATTAFSTTKLRLLDSQRSVSVYTVLGLAPSEGVTIGMAILAAFAVLVDRKLISVSRKHHRKRRK